VCEHPRSTKKKKRKFEKIEMEKENKGKEK